MEWNFFLLVIGMILIDFFYSLHFSAINLLQLVSNNSKPFKYIGDIYAIGTVRIV